MGHTSCYGCERCHIKRSWIEDCITFDANENHLVRNDDDLEHLSYNVHQKQILVLSIRRILYFSKKRRDNKKIWKEIVIVAI